MTGLIRGTAIGWIGYTRIGCIINVWLQSIRNGVIGLIRDSHIRWIRNGVSVCIGNALG